MKSIDILKQIILTDSDGNRSRVVNVRGAESGLDHLEITTQSLHERDLGITTKHKIYTSEV